MSDSPTPHADALERVVHLLELLRDPTMWHTAEYQINVTTCVYDPETHEVLSTNNEGWTFADVIPHTNSKIWITRHGVIEVDHESRAYRTLDEFWLGELSTQWLNATAELILARFERVNTSQTNGTALA